MRNSIVQPSTEGEITVIFKRDGELWELKAQINDFTLETEPDDYTTCMYGMYLFRPTLPKITFNGSLKYDENGKAGVIRRA